MVLVLVVVVQVVLMVVLQLLLARDCPEVVLMVEVQVVCAVVRWGCVVNVVVPHRV